MRVLDIGCGPAYIVEYLRGATYFGFDINSRYIAYAQKNIEAAEVFIARPWMTQLPRNWDPLT
jgi:SAM-dependent methyltransferase